MGRCSSRRRCSGVLGSGECFTHSCFDAGCPAYNTARPPPPPTATTHPFLPQTARQPAQTAAAASPLSPEEWRGFKLVRKQPLTKGVANPTVLFRFELPSKDAEVGLPVASCLLVRAPIGSEKPDGSRAFVIRPYTPISQPDERGHFDLAIKVYPAGKMSQHLDHMKVGGCCRPALSRANAKA